MSDSIQEFSEKLQKLIGKFEADKHYYFSGDYLEAQARVDFISPLFKALGWDVENEAGRARSHIDTVRETASYSR